MKFLKTIPTLIVALAAFSATPATQAKPETAKIWNANTKAHDGKTVETFVKATGDTGAIASDQAFAAIPVFTCDAGGTEGGEIFLLVPPADVEKTVNSLKSKTAGKGGAFGDKIIYQKLTATFRIVAGEPALVKGGDAKQLAGIGKPSELYAKQAAAGGLETAPAAKYPKKDFLASKQSGTSALEKLIPAINKQRAAEDPKAKPYNSTTLTRALRDGATFQVDDDAAKTTWLVKWK